jgi:ATP-dependent helicase/nuclease subunit A
MDTLTAHQRLALAHDHHLSVTANAGSGKTRVLVERYLDLVLHAGAAVGEIVALTYTEKAASELRRRIADGVATRLVQTPDPADRLRLEAVRDRLPGAFIGTIHSFCSRLLREHPVEVDVDASFVVVEGSDAQALVSESMREAFRSLLGGPAAEGEAVLRTFATVGKRRALSLLHALVSRRDLIDRLTGPDGLYSLTDEHILAHWDQMIRSAVDAAISVSAVTADAGRILSGATGKDAVEVRRAADALRDAASTPDRAMAFLALADALLTREGSVRKSVLGKGSEGEAWDAEALRLKTRAEAVRPLLPALREPAAGVHGPLLAATRTLLSTARAVLAVYDAKKHDAALLDFEDLQLLTRRLLADPAVRARLAERFRYIMIDEYQDTNQLQYDILLPLLDHLAGGNLCIVGDPKQSIYGFRGADVAVFNRTKDDIARHAGPDGTLVLEESFRPLRDLVAFVNLLFGGLMAGEEGDQSLRYEPLVRARKNSAPGRVEILLPPSGDDEEGQSEGDLIARRIAALHEAGYPVHGRDEQPHPVRYADCAILLRSRGPLPGIELALLNHHIPYLVTGGIGYFQTQDIYDFYNYLRFLLDPADDVALAGILRSPLFCVSDAELFESVSDRRGATLWGHLLSRGQTASASLRRATEILTDDCAVGRRMPVPELIARIVQRSQYAAKIAGTPRGEQSQANLDKLMRLARGYEAQGFTSLFDFVRRLQRLIDEEEKEGQGVIESRTDAVRVMTVHAAKGLEFPVVILSHLHRKFRFENELLIDEGSGIGFAMGDRSETAPVVHLMKMRARRRVVEEEKRILYVGCTRARDMLILSGVPAKAPADTHAMGWVLEAVGGVTALETDLLRCPCTTEILELEGDTTVRRGEDHVLEIPLLRTVAPVEQPQPAAMPPAAMPLGAMPLVDITRIEREGKGEIYSATKIKTYADCPARYYLQYVLGLPAGHGPFSRADDDEWSDRELPPELRGTVFHAIMEHAGTLTGREGKLGREIERVLRAEAPVGILPSPSMVETIARLVREVVSSKPWDEIMQGTDVRTEFTLSVDLGQDFLTGTIDRLYRDREGVLTILDYKTDTVDETTAAQRAEEYWPQLRFYALLVSRLYGVSRIRLVLLFSAIPHRPLRMELDGIDLRTYEADVRTAIVQIRKGIFPPKRGSCAQCPFSGSGCPDTFFQ